MEYTKNRKGVMEDFNDILETLDGEEKRESWMEDWVCESCEFGPMSEDLKKCDRCGEKRDPKYQEDEYDEDGLLKEKYEETY